MAQLQVAIAWRYADSHLLALPVHDACHLGSLSVENDDDDDDGDVE